MFQRPLITDYVYMNLDFQLGGIAFNQVDTTKPLASLHDLGDLAVTLTKETTAEQVTGFFKVTYAEDIGPFDLDQLRVIIEETVTPKLEAAGWLTNPPVQDNPHLPKVCTQTFPFAELLSLIARTFSHTPHRKFVSRSEYSKNQFAIQVNDSVSVVIGRTRVIEDALPSFKAVFNGHEVQGQMLYTLIGSMFPIDLTKVYPKLIVNTPRIAGEIFDAFDSEFPLLKGLLNDIVFID